MSPFSYFVFQLQCKLLKHSVGISLKNLGGQMLKCLNHTCGKCFRKDCRGTRTIQNMMNRMRLILSVTCVKITHYIVN